MAFRSGFVEICSDVLPQSAGHGNNAQNALLTSGLVKKAHLKIRDGIFVPEVSF